MSWSKVALCVRVLLILATNDIFFDCKKQTLGGFLKNGGFLFC